MRATLCMGVLCIIEEMSKCKAISSRHLALRPIFFMQPVTLLINQAPADPVIEIMGRWCSRLEHEFKELSLARLPKIMKHCNRHPDSFKVHKLWKHKEEIHLLAFHRGLAGRAGFHQTFNQVEWEGRAFQMEGTACSRH